MRVDVYFSDETGAFYPLEITPLFPRGVGMVEAPCLSEGGRGRSSDGGSGGGGLATGATSTGTGPGTSVGSAGALALGNAVRTINGQRLPSTNVPGPSVAGQARAQAGRLPGPSLAGQLRGENETLPGPSVAGQLRAQNPPPGPSVAGQMRANAATLSGPSLAGQVRAQNATLAGPSATGQARAQSASLSGPSVSGQMRANAGTLSGPTATPTPTGLTPQQAYNAAYLQSGNAPAAAHVAAAVQNGWNIDTNGLRQVLGGLNFPSPAINKALAQAGIQTPNVGQMRSAQTQFGQNRAALVPNGPSVAGQARAQAANLPGPAQSTPTPPPVPPTPAPATPARHPGSHAQATITAAVTAALKPATSITGTVKQYINAGIQAMAGQMPVTASLARTNVATILASAQQNGVSIASAAQSHFAQAGVSPAVSTAVQRSINRPPATPTSPAVAATAPTVSGASLAPGASLRPHGTSMPASVSASVLSSAQVRSMAAGYGFGPNTQATFASAAASGGALSGATIGDLNTAMANTKYHALAAGQQYNQAAPAVIGNGGNVPGTPAGTFAAPPAAGAASTPTPSAAPMTPSGGFANSVKAVHSAAQGTFQLAANGTTPPPPTGVPKTKPNPPSLKPTLAATGSHSTQTRRIDPTQKHAQTPVAPATARPSGITAPKATLDISNAEAWDTAVKGILGNQSGQGGFTGTAGGSLKGENTWHASQNLAAIYRLQGFDGLPTVGSKADVDNAVKKGDIELFRGMSPVAKAPSSNQMADDFRSGPYFAGDGYYGYGTYTAYNQTGKGSAHQTATSYAGHSGTIVRMALKADARVIDSSDAQSQMNSEASRWRTLNPGKQVPVVYSNEGIWAAAKGYDALKARTGVVLLNRTAVLVQDANAQDGAN